jgi:uncharacterized protein
MANWGKILSRGNVEDRRGFAPVAVGGISLTGFVVLMLVNYALGGNITDVLQQLETMPQSQQAYTQENFQGEDSYEVFASTVLGSNNDMWARIFSEHNRSYAPPRLVLFRTATESGCGYASSEVGPHYCPADSTIYLDETFFDELTQRFGAEGGDVAEAYVMAHEVGHHVQNLLNKMDDTSIQIELQADCFAGMWINSIKDLDVFTPGEIHEAMDAAAAVGDDRIQQKVTGYVSPESWTHGSSEQRVNAFNTGYETGSLEACSSLN